MHYELLTKLELREFANELKQFAYSDKGPSAFNFGRWIESKSNYKYTVVEIELIRELFNTLNSAATSMNDKNNHIRKKWKEELELLKL